MRLVFRAMDTNLVNWGEEVDRERQIVQHRLFCANQSGTSDSTILTTIASQSNQTPTLGPTDGIEAAEKKNAH